MDLSPLILWQDEHLIAVYKPSGLITIPDGYNPQLPHLLGKLKEAFGLIWVVHRLDKDTSGVILFARSAEAHRALNDQFSRRLTRKEYHAVVAGAPEWDDREIDLPLRVKGDRKHRTVVDSHEGKPASTSVRVIRRMTDLTLVAAFPHTGYTHQIRAHLAAAGLPLLGDPLYQSLIPGTPASYPSQRIGRTALHAFQITFEHPASHSPLTIAAPYPVDFQSLLLNA